MPGSRSLTEGEIELAQSIYGDAIDYTEVEIHDHRLIPWADYPHAPNGNIYYPGETHQDDFSEGGLSARKTFIHEMGHVLQNQNGVPVGWRVFRENVGGGHIRGDYEWEDKYEAGTQFSEWDLEEQAQFFGDLYSAREGGRLPDGVSLEDMETYFKSLDLETDTHASLNLNDPSLENDIRLAGNSGLAAENDGLEATVQTASLAHSGAMDVGDAMGLLALGRRHMIDAHQDGQLSPELQAVSHPDSEKLFQALVDNGVKTLNVDLHPDMDVETQVGALLLAGASAARSAGIPTSESEIEHDPHPVADTAGAGLVTTEDQHDYGIV